MRAHQEGVENSYSFFLFTPCGAAPDREKAPLKVHWECPPIFREDETPAKYFGQVPLEGTILFFLPSFSQRSLDQGFQKDLAASEHDRRIG